MYTQVLPVIDLVLYQFANQKFEEAFSTYAEGTPISQQIFRVPFAEVVRTTQSRTHTPAQTEVEIAQQVLKMKELFLKNKLADFDYTLKKTSDGQYMLVDGAGNPRAPQISKADVARYWN